MNFLCHFICFLNSDEYACDVEMLKVTANWFSAVFSTVHIVDLMFR